MTPKKDKCDKCEPGRTTANIFLALDGSLQVYIANKLVTYQERRKVQNNKTRVVLCFDLENVLVYPFQDFLISFIKDN